MRLDVMVQDFLYFILARSILHPAASAGTVFSIPFPKGLPWH